MNDKYILNGLQNLPLAYSFHKIILDENNKPIDYQFLEVNTLFEEMTGLKKELIIGKTVKECIPDIVKDDFNWIEFYGEVAINGIDRDFEKHSEYLGKTYRVYVYSPEKYYFVTIFIDISNISKIKENKRDSKWKLYQ